MKLKKNQNAASSLGPWTWLPARQRFGPLVGRKRELWLFIASACALRRAGLGLEGGLGAQGSLVL